MKTLFFHPLSRLAVFIFGFVGSTFAQSGADNFPTKPIRLIVPYAAGGGTHRTRNE